MKLPSLFAALLLSAIVPVSALSDPSSKSNPTDLTNWLTAPNGGTYTIGQTISLTVNSSLLTVGTLQIELWKGSTKVIGPSAGGMTGRTLSTTGLTAGADYRVRIYNASNPAEEDWSNNYIHIGPIPTNFTNWLQAPNGGEIFSAGSDIPITRDITLYNPSSLLSVEIYKGATKVVGPIVDTPYDRSISTAGLATGTDYKVKIYDTNNTSRSDMSDNNFTIVDLSNWLTAPAGGGTYASGPAINLTINSALYNPPGATIVVEMYKGSTKVYGPSYSGITGRSVPTSGMVTGSDYRVRIYNYSDPTMEDWSNNFTITGLESWLQSPNGSEVYNVGDVVQLGINSALYNPGGVRAHVYKGSEKVKEGGVSGIANYNVSFSDLEPGTDYRIKLENPSLTDAYDFSDNTFSILDFSEWLTTPDGGTTASIGTNLVLQLNTGLYNPASLSVELYKGATKVYGPTSGAATGRTIPTAGMAAGTDYRVKIFDTAKPQLADWSYYFKLEDGTVSTDKNYVITELITQSGLVNDSDVTNAAVTGKQTTVSFFDDVGRPLQTKHVKGSPAQRDIITVTEYDAFGREEKKYLPFVNSVSTGTAFVTGATNNTLLYYNNPDPGVASDVNPYAKTVFENSPLNRVIKQGSAGAAWQPDATNTYASTDRTVKKSYGQNAANEVIKWTYTYPDATYLLGRVNSGSGGTPAYYDANSLLKNRTRDESGNEVIEYNDKQGRTVLKRVQAVAGSVSLNDINYASTYYIYNPEGNLVTVIPPEATRLITQTTPASEYFNKSDSEKENFMSRWTFRYVYDGRDRMTHKQVPGAGPVYMVYDNRDRLVATQDANQRSTANKYWTFTKYDPFNRPVLTGIKDTTAALTQAQMQAVVDGHYAKAWTKLFETYVGTTTGNMHGYSNKSYPVLTGPTTSNDKDRYLSVTYYDDYGYKATLADSNRYTFSTNHLAGQTDGYFKRLIGQVTGTKIKVLDGGVTGNYTWLTTVNYYDDDYRVIQTVSDNYKGGTDRITNKFDFTGKVLKSKATQTTYDVNWKDLVGVSFQGNRIYRSATSASWGTSGAASVEQLGASENGWVEVNVTDNTSQRMFGLSDSNPDAGINNLDYAVYINGSVLRVYKNGSLAPSGNLAGATVTGELLRWERNGTNLYLKRNGTTVYTFTGVTTAALMADVSFYTLNGSVANVKASFAETAHTITRSFTYDHAGRVLNVSHRLDSEDSVVLVKNEYNELGQLVDKKLHSTDGGTFKQSLDYAYNIRGWLTKMNESDLSGTDEDAGRDLFGMQLGYNDDLGISNTALYNGNISGIKWSRNLALGDTTQNAYVYSYDPMNRITSSAFREKVPASWQTASNYGNNETGFTYDLNGNILTLQRNDRRTSGWMDNLTYDYGTGTAQSNKLLKVTDAGDKTKGFVDGSAAGSTVTDYAYDANGNLVWDRNKGGAELVVNGNFDNGSTGWTLTNSGRLTFTNGEVQIATGAANSTLTQTNPANNKPFLVTIEVERTAGTLNVYLGGQNTNITASGTYMFNFTTSGNSNLVLTPQGTFSGKIKSVSVKGQTVITYNFLNLPEIVTRPGDKQLQYIYDASGRKLRQEVSKNTVMEKTTDYAGEYIYENDTLRFINHEEGRIVPGLSGAEDWEYQYHLKDHLGNVRMTFTSRNQVNTYTGTLETANQTAENAEFDPSYSHATIINSSLYNHTASGSKSQRLSGANTDEIVGLARSLSVMPGDTVNITVYGKYYTPTTTNSNSATSMLASMAQAFGLSAMSSGEGLLAYNRLNEMFGSGFFLTSEDWDDPDAPKAFLNFILFDKNYNVVDMGWDQIDEDALETGSNVAHDLLQLSTVVTEPGYMYIYLSNENNKLVDVYFDDLTIQHKLSPVVQQDDYYAFGLNFNSYQRENSVKNKMVKFQGQEHIDDLDLGWESFKWRNYMSDIGRFFNVDPLAEKYPFYTPYAFSGNEVTSSIELEGLEPLKLKSGVQTLIIGNQGYEGVDPRNGRTQARNGGDANGIGKLSSLENATTQVGIFSSSQSSNTQDDIASTISAFKEANPDGTVVVVGHSLGADNLVEMAKGNEDVQVDKMVLLDLADYYSDTDIPGNVKNVTNFYQKNDFPGGDKVTADDPNKTVVDNVQVFGSTHRTIDEKQIDNVISIINSFIESSKKKADEAKKN